MNSDRAMYGAAKVYLRKHGEDAVIDFENHLYNLVT